MPVLESSSGLPEEQVELVEVALSALWAAFITMLTYSVPRLKSAGSAGAAESLELGEPELAPGQHELPRTLSW